MPKVSPEVQRLLVSQHRPGVRGAGYKSLANKYKLAITTVRKIILRSKVRPGSFFVSKQGRKATLTAAEISRMTNALEENPTMSNTQLAQLVNDKIKPQAVSKYLKRESVPFVKRKLVNVEPQEYEAEWRRKATDYLDRVSTIPLTKRIYEDETAIFDNESKRYGRVRLGSIPIRAQTRYGKKYVLHIWAKQTGVMHWELRDKNATDDECLKVGRRAIQKLDEGDTLIWDQLGKSGTCRNPVAQHFNPVLMRALHNKNINVIHLPPKGKYFNPIELLNNDLKEHYIRPQRRNDGQNMSKRKLLKIIRYYMTNKASRVLPGFFRKRASDSHVIEMGLL